MKSPTQPLFGLVTQLSLLHQKHEVWMGKRSWRKLFRIMWGKLWFSKPRKGTRFPFKHPLTGEEALRDALNGCVGDYFLWGLYFSLAYPGVCLDIEVGLKSWNSIVKSLPRTLHEQFELFHLDCPTCDDFEALLETVEDLKNKVRYKK